MKKFLVFLYFFVFYFETNASELYCEFTVYGLVPFIETSVPIVDGVLGDEVTVIHQGQPKTYSLLLEKTVAGEKYKFTIVENNPEGDIYITVFDEAGSVDGSFKAQATNPAITIPIGKDVPGYCLIRE